MTKYYNREEITHLRQLLRRNAPKPEKILWESLRRRQILGYKFRRQFSIGTYVIDFYCPALKLAVEIDGPEHSVPSQLEYEEERTSFLESFGIMVLRISNKTVLEDPSQAVRSIRDTIERIQ